MSRRSVQRFAVRTCDQMKTSLAPLRGHNRKDRNHEQEVIGWPIWLQAEGRQEATAADAGAADAAGVCAVGDARRDANTGRARQHGETRRGALERAGRHSRAGPASRRDAMVGSRARAPHPAHSHAR